VIYGPRHHSRKLVITAHDRVLKLHTAIEAAHRLRKQRIYTGTIEHWQSLLEEAGQFLGEMIEPEDENVRALAAQLEAIVATRLLAAGRPAKHPLRF